MGETFSAKNVSQCRKKIKGDPLVLPGMECYAEKQGKPFWSSSLGQMVQFDTIIFGRTFKNYFGQFVWIEKNDLVIIIVAFLFKKRRLKTERTKMSLFKIVIFVNKAQKISSRSLKSELSLRNQIFNKR